MSDIYIPPGGGGGNTTATYLTEADEHVALANSYQLAAGTNITLTPASGTPNTLTITSTGGSAAAGGTNGQIQYNNSTALGGFTASGDATINTSTGAVAVTKTGGVAFATSATTDTTNASNIASGTLPAAQLPNPTATTLGGIESLAAVSHKWINTISTSGVPSATQPAFTDISGTATAAQMLALADTNIYVGNGSNVPAAVAMSGNVTLSDTGVATIATSVALAGSPTTTTQSAGDNSTKISTTAFVTTAVNNAIAGVNPAVAVQAATTTAGNTSGLTYNNGVGGVGATFTGSNNTAITWDGYTFTALGQRGLVKNDTQAPSGAFNGIYYVTQVQTAILPPILTRALDYDQSSDINNTGAIPVINGTVNGTTSWILTSAVTTVGTDPLTYTQFTLNPANVLTSTATGLIIALPFFMQTGANITIQLDAYAAFGYTINAINGIATSSGTVTAAVQIGGTNVTGLSAISVTSTPQNVSASAANVVVATNQVTLVLSSNSSATNLCFTMKMTRS